MKSGLFSIVAAFALLAVSPVHAQGGFVDEAGMVTVAAARSLRDEAPVRVQGRIVRALGDEKYLFHDAGSEIVVEIDDDVWRGVTVGPDDAVEIRGEIDRDFPGFPVEIEVDAIKKL
ncbi:MAG: NirD/YgiW/YdeI family stress tolerance protein [Candidatus Accumulibacter sp.]|jgi:uncharacterized protein (TIGR00156 family)|nr:NirD/YgiW/YdeI family stress tolerance protein [Accumulibacter sp.]